MANPSRRLPQNVAGNFFVDSTCINCDTCRQLAPGVFDDSGDYSFVRNQPHSSEEEREALRALLACPTGSIGTVEPNRAREVSADFPIQIEGDVFYCGFNSAKSFGGNSYFVRHPAGNWLIDSPKYLPQLVRKFESLGGIAHIFLTHRDDVADAARYAKRFGSRRTIHRNELDSQPDAENVIDGNVALELAPGFVAIPSPGHTAGHCLLYYAGRYLFTGDHLWWNRDERELGASRNYCWYSWPEQTKSMERLCNVPFEWVLPGHGQRVHLPVSTMRGKLELLVEQMT